MLQLVERAEMLLQNNEGLMAFIEGIAPGDPGAWYFHHDTTVEWARQMTAEVVNDKGLWECLEGRASHAWDVSVYTLAVAEVLGIKFRARNPAPKPTQKNY